MEKIVIEQSQKPEVLIVVNGFSVEGKTSFVYRTKLDDVRTSIPRFDIDVENNKQENVSVLSFKGWGRDNGRPLLIGITTNADAVVFLSDISNMDSLMEAKTDFDSLFYYKDPIFAIAVNNHAVGGAIPVSQVQDIFKLQKFRKKHPCKVFPVSTTTGEGLSDMMEWVWMTLKERKEAQQKKDRSERLFNVSFLKAPGQFIKRLFTKI